MENEAIDEATAFEADRVWIDAHISDLQVKYANYWIAVRDGHVIASAADLGELLGHVPDLEHTCVEFINEPAAGAEIEFD
jgi:hypothetical protein